MLARASSWERELICGRRGWLSKPFISLTHLDDENSLVDCTQSIGIALQQFRRTGDVPERGFTGGRNHLDFPGASILLKLCAARQLKSEGL